MFTDRFLSVPVRVYDIDQKDLTGKSDDIETYRKINPFEIAEYGPTDVDDNDIFDKTVVEMKGGSRFTVFLTVEEFERLLNSFVK